MAVVASITLDKEGNPTSGDGDVLVGDRDDHLKSVIARLSNIAHHAGADIAEIEQEIRAQAEAIVDGHRIIAPGDEIPADASAPTEVHATGEHAVSEPAE